MSNIFDKQKNILQKIVKISEYHCLPPKRQKQLRVGNRTGLRTTLLKNLIYDTLNK